MKLSPATGLPFRPVKMRRISRVGHDPKKFYDDCIVRPRSWKGPMEDSHADCFVVNGSKVLEGVSSYVVVAVGTKSSNGRTMMGLCFLFFSPAGL